MHFHSFVLQHLLPKGCDRVCAELCTMSHNLASLHALSLEREKCEYAQFAVSQPLLASFV